MKGNRVITIGRECGSGGRLIGNKLAEKLGIKCYDKELLTLAAKQSGLCEELFEAHDEKPSRSFLYSLVMDSYSLGYSTSSFADMPLNHKVFLAQFETIKHLADTESCVIVGRCADYALVDYPNTTSVFITGNMEDKIRYMCRLYNKTEDQAKDIITKTDKKRANYYNYYSSKKWGDARSYDLCLNSSILGPEGAVEAILNFLRLRENKGKDETTWNELNFTGK
ncbi:MAG: cytidylate kinase-like family protein [Parasporobacterium sp.]|nr:cytidylate kinase-like family protein [Parasporobacterium sp.]